ncbi:MAG: hypothetical protein GY778_15700 [bacterium]|nr:hypothetical protein [bacterium]
MFTASLLTGLAVWLPAAGQDNNVEWNGISHVSWQDRRPLCPIGGEAFDVLIRTWQNDLSSVRVRVNDGSVVWVDAAFDHDRGPYAVWRAPVPFTAASGLGYLIELTDGTDTDYFTNAGMLEDFPAVPDDFNLGIDYTTLEHAPIGATPTSDGGTVFKVWAPEPTTAYVRGQFNGWGLGNPMTKVDEHFMAHVPAASYRQTYRYYFADTDHWRSDPRGRSLNPSSNYDTHIEDPFLYPWGDDDFQTPPFEEMVIYELHVGTFAGRNDPQAPNFTPAKYEHVAVHVDHLVELGINAVELMPINEFPLDFSAGYNPVTYWTPEWIYGDPDDLKNLVDVLHQNGIAVLSDIVWNHCANVDLDKTLWSFTGPAPSTIDQIYFDGDGITCPTGTLWGCQPDFDCDGVRAYLADSTLYWLEEFHLDGFRMDATDFMNISPQEASGWSLMQWHNDLIDLRAINAISIAEQLPDDASVTQATSAGGAGFDAQWHDAFTDRLREEIFDAAVGDPEMWKIRNIVNGSGVDLSNTKVVNYLELHDEAWPDSGGQRMVVTIDTTAPHDDIYAKGRTKLGQGVVMFAPGIPMILQGTEWLEDTAFGAGDSDGNDRIDWSKKTTYANIFGFYKDMIAIRRSHCAMRSDGGHSIIHEDDTNNVLAWSRGLGQELVVVVNFSNYNYTGYNINLPAGGTWHEILNSQASDYDGNGWGNGGSVFASGGSNTASMVIPQMGLLVFRHESAAQGGTDVNGDGSTDLYDYFVLQQQFGAIGCGLSADVDQNGRVNLDDHAELYANLTGPS